MTDIDYEGAVEDTGVELSRVLEGEVTVPVASGLRE